MKNKLWWAEPRTWMKRNTQRSTILREEWANIHSYIMSVIPMLKWLFVGCQQWWHFSAIWLLFWSTQMTLFPHQERWQMSTPVPKPHRPSIPPRTDHLDFHTNYFPIHLIIHFRERDHWNCPLWRKTTKERHWTVNLESSFGILTLRGH